MADKKISELTELSASPASDDYFVVLDTDASATKKIQAKYLLGIPAAWTPTFTGWTGSVLGIFRYVVIGKTCIARITITSGTSNATTATATLPIASANIPNQVWDGACGRTVNSGSIATVAGRWELAANSDIVNFYSDMGTGAWTNSGTKLMRATIIYEIA